MAIRGRVPIKMKPMSSFLRMLKLALDFMDDWSTVSAEIVAMALAKPGVSQKEIAKELSIQQSAVSQRQKRARLHLVHDLLNYYKQTRKEIKL